MEYLETSLLLRWEKTVPLYIKNKSWESKDYCLYSFFFSQLVQMKTQDQQFAYLETSFIIKNIGLLFND